ncbi:uncharacterized protein SPPG_05009 [Spizellomyces punctatus DAOM BR117]|uniref:DUF676 domain-containing protein n=1 Tax=Spizellomyces punctatus (strain DAOM BR117) TaxID=645134 RepID=A0A0L0HFS1_SPIPD|nr:uncharacterized protein SPPG_05009 [Spizellomyces punctatus DAOM BR117]KNC99623.1 hypothetical protein SPPG_05009 [Spizellomyces punctatus DAOM BR117]|eukprot:XP_016607663.1 hypothetical protein SPPG_05009 [Spizellomyces punctatus DAOM BR117]
MVDDQTDEAVGRALVVISLNGNHGQPTDFDNFIKGLESQFRTMISSKASQSTNTTIHAHQNAARKTKTISRTVPAGRHVLFTLQSSTSRGFGTHDGIPLMAKRAALEVVEWFWEEIVPVLREKVEGNDDNISKWVVHLSVVGHSLGGLIARYLIKLLLERLSVGRNGTSAATSLRTVFDANGWMTLKPLTFMTVCSPHFGSRRSAKPGSWTAPVFQGIVRFYLTNIAGQTGKELYLIDGTSSLSATEPWSDDSRVPLLIRMADPRSSYMSTLREFRPILVAAVRNDIPVGYCSAAVTSVNPHAELLSNGGEVGAVVEVTAGREVGLRVMSFSGFRTEAVPTPVNRKIGLMTKEEADPVRQFWVDRLFGGGSIQDDPILQKIRTDQTVEILGPRGTMHHHQEPFHDAPLYNDPPSYNGFLSSLLSPPPPTAPTDAFVPDHHHDNLIPTRLLARLQETLWNARRINIDFVLSNPVSRATVHALAVGKAEGGVLNVDGQVAAQQAGWFLARIVLLDYLYACDE